MKNGFFALIARSRNIIRWGLMRNSFAENAQEHAAMTAVIAHALAVISNREFGGAIDSGACAAAALYHDAAEIITGDLPTPIKYHNPELTEAYKRVESLAVTKLLDTIPETMRPDYAALLSVDDVSVRRIVKAADKLAAYVKCVQERSGGNAEFLSAERNTLAALNAMQMPEVNYFIDNFLPAFGLNLDELTGE
ncbi:MAG: 5'-deoxynucleotidase [Oscillospiraceae bacterium]|jgi:5'-deoxynucleotidase|nr:5'-deoxynucleotidase [Oscillospiraceae bacterium]